MLEAVSGEVVDATVAARFYQGVTTGAGTLIWATRRRPTHDELVRAWPARKVPGRAEFSRGWWQPTIEILREERRKAASLNWAVETRRQRSS
ncbi:hypothetical protein ASF24_03695 [Methylobacterium sp. Leaf86]|nr:hypothetical protein ASF24_03695 [Methylobacterium sp. Leaf86]